MNIKISALTIGLLITSVVFNSPVMGATFIDNDIYTTDTEGGLDWLDITSTVGRNYDEISSLMGYGEEFYGWRYAYGTEFQTMVNNFTGINNTSFSAINYWDSFVMQDLLNMTGIAYQQVNGPQNIVYQTIGILEDTNGNGDHMASYILHHMTETTKYGESRVEQGYYSPSGNQPNMGAFLVRDIAVVPAPPTLILMISGLLGIFGISFSKKN